MSLLLIKVSKFGGSLAFTLAQREDAEQECSAAVNTKKKAKIARLRARNLLEHLRDFKTETLQFRVDEKGLFPNNQTENDLRMTKMQQKTSDCF
jgi:transposase